MRTPSLAIPSLLAAAFFASCEGALAARPRHVILVTVESVRAGDPSGFPFDFPEAQGTRFARAFAPCGEILPSTATLLTGRPPSETCAIGNEDVLPSSERTLAELLKEAGFRTAAFTASRLLGEGSGLEQGFDRFVADSSLDRDEGAVRSAEEWLASQDLSGGPPLFVWVHLVGSAAPTEIGRGELPVGRFLSFCSGKEANQPVDLLPKSLLVLTAVRGSDLHVPLLVRHPASLAAGKRIERVVGLEDIAPTVLDFLRLDAEEAMHGRSLVHVLRGGLADPRPAFGVRRDGTTTVRDERWRLVWNPGRVEPQGAGSGSSPNPGVALFDASTDPGETNDLARSHPEVVADLQDAISKWQAGLEPCDRSRTAPTPERIQALREMGYLESDR